MLHFFRKHQKYFFLVITFVIVMTFIFFGSYQAIAPMVRGGVEEKNHETLMSEFLNSENWMVSRRVLETNFLNDGVISKEFLETGMAQLMAKIKPEDSLYREKFEKEKSYISYQHPLIPTLSAEMIWSHCAPEIPGKLKAFQKSGGSFKARSELFLAQKNFPPSFLTQFIRYQEQSYPQSFGDPKLMREDIAIFGYQNLSDWFGEKFVDLFASEIIKIAQQAKKLGYQVSRNELLAELVTRSEEFYQNLKGKIELPVSDGYGLMTLYLHYNGLKEEQLLKIWEDVTLFRRLMQAVGSAALVDPLPLEQFYTFAFANATVELFQMTPELRFRSLEELKEFETYITLVGAKCGPGELPLEYAPLSTIELQAPELLGKRYALSFASITKKALQSKVSLKETLQWECELSNWNLLKKQFPELAQKRGDTFEVLEHLDGKTRKLVDAYARSKIVDAHPEWIDEALATAKMDKKEIFLTPGVKKSFEGIADTAALAKMLEKNDEIIRMTQDDYHYYRFVVNGRGQDKEILSFKAAKKEGILLPLAEKVDVDSRISFLKNICPQSFQEKFYEYRFASFISKYHSEPPRGALAHQFLIEKKEKIVSRSEPSLIQFNDILKLKKGAFSEIKNDPLEGIYLYKFVDAKVEKTVPLEKMRSYQELLAKEAKCRFFEKLLIAN